MFTCRIGEGGDDSIHINHIIFFLKENMMHNVYFKKIKCFIFYNHIVFTVHELDEESLIALHAHTECLYIL